MLLESLRHKRAYRRGQVTKVKTKVQHLQTLPPDEIDPMDVEGLLEELTIQLKVHGKLQTQIEELYEAYPDLAVDEEDEKDRISDTHRSVKSLVIALQKALPLWNDCSALLRQVEHKLDHVQADSPVFRTSLESLNTRFTTLSSSIPRSVRVLPPLGDRWEILERKLNALVLEVESGCRDIPSPATAPVISSTAAPVVAVTAASSLHLELPHFDGDPFKWKNFATMFRATIKARAKGHSKLEIKGHLLRAVKHPAGQKLLNNLPSDDLGLDEMLQLLEEKFGSTEVLTPLIISKIQSVTKFNLSSSDVDHVHDSFILPFQKFVSVVGDSLSSYLAMLLTSMMSPECKREWLRHTVPGAPATMENIVKFVKYWQHEFNHVEVSSPATNLSRQTPSGPSSFTPTAPTSPQCHGKQTHVRRPPPRRGQSSCLVCQESHTLSRCPTFGSYSVDRRNKLVREKRLCLNCFQEGHGCRQCPSKFSCRHCGGRHHSLLPVKVTLKTQTHHMHLLHLY